MAECVCVCLWWRDSLSLSVMLVLWLKAQEVCVGIGSCSVVADLHSLVNTSRVGCEYLVVRN